MKRTKTKFMAIIMTFSLLVVSACSSVGDLLNVSEDKPTQSGTTDQAQAIGVADTAPQSGFGIWEYHNYRYEGNFQNGKPNGSGTLYIGHAESTGLLASVIDGYWVDGIADGEISLHMLYINPNIDVNTYDFAVVNGSVPTEITVTSNNGNGSITIIKPDILYGVPPWADVKTNPNVAPPGGATADPFVPSDIVSLSITQGEGRRVVLRLTVPNLQELITDDVWREWRFSLQDVVDANGGGAGAELSKHDTDFFRPPNIASHKSVYIDQNNIIFDYFIPDDFDYDWNALEKIIVSINDNGQQVEMLPFNKSRITVPLEQIIRPTDPNEHGNTMGNIINGSFAVLKGNTIYYIGDYANDNGGIFKTNTDGTGQTQISERSITCLQVVGDWIYFRGSFSDSGGNIYYGIHKIHAEWTYITPTLVYASENGFLRYVVVGNWIYFTEEQPDGNWALYKIRTAGIDKTLIEKDSILINAEGGWVYYITIGGGLHKIRTDGSERTQLSILPEQARGGVSQIDGDWLYYNIEQHDRYGNLMSQGLSRIRLDGTGEMVIITDRVRDFIVDGDWIYYANFSDNRALYRIRTDGTGNMKLDDTIVYGALNIVGDWIYVQKTAMGMATPQPPILHKIRMDGTNLQVVD